MAFESGEQVFLRGKSLALVLQGGNPPKDNKAVVLEDSEGGDVRIGWFSVEDGNLVKTSVPIEDLASTHEHDIVVLRLDDATMLEILDAYANVYDGFPVTSEDLRNVLRDLDVRK